MALVLKLTDGTTTLDLNDGVNYGIPYDRQSWTPAVSKRKWSGLGGWVYQDVEERIPLHIRGATGADALGNLDALINLLDQAERWWLGEDVACVRLLYKPHNSNLSDPVEAEVLGPVGSTTPWLQLSPYLHDAANHELPEIELRVMRRGDWLGDVDTPATDAGGQPSVLEITFAEDVPLYSPLSIDLANIGYENQDGLVIPNGVIFLASAANKLKLLQAEAFSSSGATSSTCTSQADAAASGAFYAQFDHGQDGYWNLDTSDIDGDLLAVYALCHQSSGSAVWQLTTEIYREATSGINLQSATKIVTGLSYQPVFLGMLGRADDDFTLHIQALRLSGSGTIGIDYQVILALGQPSERAIGFTGINAILPYSGGATDVIYRQLAIRDYRLSQCHPRFRVELTSNDSLVTYLGYDGDIALVSKGESLFCVVMAAGGGAFGTWLWVGEGGASRTLTAMRRRAYLAPR